MKVDLKSMRIAFYTPIASNSDSPNAAFNAPTPEMTDL